MGRRPLPLNERKVNLTIRVEKQVLVKLKKIKGYNSKIQCFITKLVKDTEI